MKPREVILRALLSGAGFGSWLRREAEAMPFSSVEKNLRELSDEGLVEKVEEPLRPGGQPLRFYRLTEAGRAAAEAKLGESLKVEGGPCDGDA